MNKELPILEDYFYSPARYFWHWTEKNQVIEWYNGSTICYRDDLLSLLRELNLQGLPPLGAVLLVLDACKNGVENAAVRNSHMHRVLLTIERTSHTGPDQATQQCKNVIGFLRLIANLPDEYKTGTGRVLLLQTIFQHLQDHQKYTRDVLTMFDSGENDTRFLLYGRTPLEKRFAEDMEALQPATHTFASTEQLLQRLRTGVSVLPQPAVLPLPETTPVDLFAELAEDPRTAGLTRLAQRLIAALKIPMHASGSSDQLFGGVSDISNRGNFDRLLLSELAHDDISLMARLANNEALYLRREELPAQRNREWTILLDTTLRMWGLPRVFAVSAALACTNNIKAAATQCAYALSGNDSKAIDLSTKAGVIAALEQQAAALHCAGALTAFMEQRQLTSDMTSFLVTDEQNMSDPAFIKALTETRDSGGFLITVNRNGQLHFYELAKGGKKLISKASFDLEELLFEPANEKPAALNVRPFPFWFPASKMRFTADHAFEIDGSGVICITEDRRVLYWPSSGAGALEIITYIDEGIASFGYNQQTKSNIYILVCRATDGKVRLYNIDLSTFSVTDRLVHAQVAKEAEILFSDHHFYVIPSPSGETLKINVNQGGLVKSNGLSETLLGSLRQSAALSPYKRNNIKRHINNGYSVFTKADTICIVRGGHIKFDRWVLTQDTDGRIKIRASKSDRDVKNICRKKDTFYPLPNPNIPFHRFQWLDGSEAILDSRGFMHLRSSDPTIPEISFVLALEKHTAFWTADGKTFGNQYFLNGAVTEKGTGFYENYIQRFIDVLK